MKEQILILIHLRGSVDNTELILGLMTTFGPFAFDNVEYKKCINALLEEGEIHRLGFTTRGRTDCIYFPKGTIYEFRGVEVYDKNEIRNNEESPRV